MTLNKKLLTIAVGSALTLSLAAPAEAYNLLFPYVVKDGSNKTTIVTFMGDSASSNGSVHIQYYSKAVTDANTAACAANSFVIPFTENDMVTFDTGGVFGFPVLGDVTNSTVPLIAPVMGGSGNRHGYMVAGGATSNGFSGYAGYWLEVDLATAGGGLHGDVAGTFLSADIGPTIPFQLIPTPPFNSTAVQFLPPAGVKTEFTVTPLGTAMISNENTTVTVKLNYNFGGSTFGVYDRNENILDGGAKVAVRCVGRVTLAQLLPLNIANPAFANGGWGWLENLGDDATTTNDFGAMVYQVESVSGGGKYYINATRISSFIGIF